MSKSENEPEKLDPRSPDIAEEKRSELLRIFPEVQTEGGKIDFDRLKLTLGETVDVGRERYGMTWPGKADSFKTIQAPSLGTLLPCRDESINFDATENLIIEGDNLEVLKLLQKSYLAKIKMIYIDPPYNTGNDFIYPDNYTESLQTYLEYTGQLDADGKKFSTNTETDGRFHSKWLNMMYPRLYLARNLLAEDGVIFISIDDKEVHNLRRLCDEIFGEENRVGTICWKNVTDNNPTLITPDNEFIVCYVRSRDAQPRAWTSRFSVAKDLLQAEYERLRAQGLRKEDMQARIREFISDNEESLGFLSRYKFVDDEGIYTASESVHNPRLGGYDFEILHPASHQPMRKPATGYRFPEKTFREMDGAGIILYGEDEKRIVKIKKYLADYEDALRSVITLDGRLGSYELKRLFPGGESIFTNPKPSELIESLISFVAGQDSTVLDFFAGSGSTGDATLALNRKDGGTRKFILVQLPEPCDESTAAYRQGLRNVAEITKERIRRVIQTLSAGAPARAADTDQAQLALPVPADPDEPQLGFRSLKLAESNLVSWDAGVAHVADALEQQLDMHINHVVAGRGQEDILYEILLKNGYPLGVPVENIVLDGKTVFSIASGDMLVCLEPALTLELIRAMASKKPSRVICLDEGFAGNDQLKANAVHTFKNVVSFKTV
jgi:adenine-specific DNA-methyltransferase